MTEPEIMALQDLALRWEKQDAEYAGPCGTGCAGCTAARNANELRKALAALQGLAVKVQEPETVVTYDEQTDCMVVKSTFRIVMPAQFIHED